MRRLVLLSTFVATAGPLSAQTATAVHKAAETIVAKDVVRHLDVIAADSMMGRDTPSRGLELTTQYVADQFKKFGLKPGGDNGTYLQRYSVGRALDFAQSRVVFAAGGKEGAASFATAARLAVQAVPEEPASTGVVLVAGRHTPQSIAQASVGDKVVLYVAPVGIDSALRLQLVNRLFSASKGLIIISDQDSATFARRVRSAFQRPMVSVGPKWAAHVRAEAVKDSLKGVFTAAGFDLAQARADTMPVIRALPQLTARLDARVDLNSTAATAANTVGILEGSDPKLKNEYIIYSAHMDAVGIRSGSQPDSIVNGAEDNGSGTVGVIELAEAFSQPGARPRRSVIFLTVSGEEKGLWGSGYFVEHPPVPIQQIAVNINFDEIGSGRRDGTQALVHVTGADFSDLGATLARMQTAHPELSLKMFPEERMTSDHFQFARKGVPVLRFGGGQSEDEHQVTDSADKIDGEFEVAVLRLSYYIGQEAANADQRPQWNKTSYDRLTKSDPWTFGRPPWADAAK